MLDCHCAPIARSASGNPPLASSSGPDHRRAGKPTTLAPAPTNKPPASVPSPRPRIANSTSDQSTLIELHKGATAHLGGSMEDEFNALIICETLACAQPSFGQDQTARLAAVSAALAAFKPKDEIEGMIAAQEIGRAHV